MNDFLSNLMERSFTDAPVIRPRVPSLFEPTRPVDFSDEQQSSTSAPISELSRVQTIAIANSIAPVTDIAEEHLSKPAASRPKAVAAETLPEGKDVIVPLASSRGAKDHSTSTSEVFENFSKTPASRSMGRKDFSPVDQQSSKSPPIIRVRIGRVEVRAVQSPAPGPKQAKSRPPKLSLEDYLRKRARGSR
jgi:hypothetical protein